ncbi:MAG: alpha/beta hydrolase [Pseudomonadota bacterium]
MPAGAEALTFKAADGAVLRGALFKTPKADKTLVLLTGWSEFIEKYFETVSDMQARGFNVAMMDWRSQGLSQRFGDTPSLTHMEDFDLFRQDIITFTDEVVAPQMPGPYYLMTHSMGGAPALALLADGDTRFKAAALCAPLTRLATSSFVIFAAKTIAGLGVALGAGERGSPRQGDNPERFDERALTHEVERHNHFLALQRAKPEAAVAGQTLAWVKAAIAAMDDLHRPERFTALKTPVLIISAGQDRLCDSNDHAQLAKTAPLIENVLIKDARHEIMMERDDLRDAYFDAVDTFFGKHQ